MGRPLKTRTAETFRRDVENLMRSRSAVALHRPLPPELREKVDKALHDALGALGEVLAFVESQESA